MRRVNFADKFTAPPSDCTLCYSFLAVKFLISLLTHQSPNADADFIAFKQQAEADLELLPSAEAQLELQEQQKKAQPGQRF